MIALPYSDNYARCIEADFPWNYKNVGMRGNQGGTRPDQNLNPGYPVMDLAEIVACGAEIRRIAFEKCHLWLWTVEPFLTATEQMMALWGFPVKRRFNWIKTTDGLNTKMRGLRDFSQQRLDEALEVMQAIGLPGKPYPRAGGRYYGKTDCEYLLMGTNNKSYYLANGKHEAQTFFAPVPSGKHSAKPGKAYSIIQRNSHKPRISLFQRTSRSGFECWGNQLNS
jgi:N6-adenosine-specific RNA methylase IME4